MISFLLILHICPGIFLMRVPTYLILVHTTYLCMIFTCFALMFPFYPLLKTQSFCRGTKEHMTFNSIPILSL